MRPGRERPGYFSIAGRYPGKISPFNEAGARTPRIPSETSKGSAN